MTTTAGALRRTLRRPVLVDGVLAAVLVVFSLLALWDPPPFVTFDFREPDVLGVALVVLACGPIAFRSRFLVSAVASLLHAQLGYAQGIGGLATLFPLYTVAAQRGFRLSASMAGLTLAGVVAVLVAGPYDATLSDWGSNLLVLAIAWMLGRSVRTRRQRQADLDLRNRALEEAREAETRAMLVRERARTAREMQDLVAHNLTEIGVQVAAARRLMARDPGTAEQVLLEAERVGRAALDELRRVGGVLKEPDTPAEREPQPGLEAVRRLVDRRRAAGARTDYTLAFTDPAVADAVPAGVALTAYRVVEELLGRVSDREAAVTLGGDEERLTVEVTWGRGSTVRWDESPEAGLERLRARVAVYGGELVVGRRRDGTVRTSATFPLAGPSARGARGEVRSA
jgi:signal transduction histidine kinase